MTLTGEASGCEVSLGGCGVIKRSLTGRRFSMAVCFCGALVFVGAVHTTGVFLGFTVRTRLYPTVSMLQTTLESIQAVATALSSDVTRRASTPYQAWTTGTAASREMMSFWGSPRSGRGSHRQGGSVFRAESSTLAGTVTEKSTNNIGMDTGCSEAQVKFDAGSTHTGGTKWSGLVLEEVHETCGHVRLQNGGTCSTVCHCAQLTKRSKTNGHLKLMKYRDVKLSCRILVFRQL